MDPNRNVDPNLAVLREKLVTRRSQLQQEIADGLRASRREDYTALAGQVHDREDESLADLLADVGLADVRRDALEVSDIDAALGRMRAGTYGTCQDCGAAIGSARLRAYPAAKRCWRCQESHEQRGGRAHTATL